MQDMNIQQLSSKGGKAPRKPYRFSIQDIALVAQKSVAAVRKDRQRGKFNPFDLNSLTEYLSK